MSTVKNQKKVKKSKEKQISVFDQIINVISLEEKDILFKFVVDFLNENHQYRILMVVLSSPT